MAYDLKITLFSSSMKKILLLPLFFLLIVLVSGCSKTTQIKSIWQGVYYEHGKQENEMYGPVFVDNFDACKTWALSKKNNSDDLVNCNKNCHDSLEDGTPICEAVVRNWAPFPGSDTFDNYKE